MNHKHWKPFDGFEQVGKAWTLMQGSTDDRLGNEGRGLMFVKTPYQIAHMIVY